MLFIVSITFSKPFWYTVFNVHLKQNPYNHLFELVPESEVIWFACLFLLWLNWSGKHNSKGKCFRRQSVS